jgi:uncharacterized membrane protein (UPF0182 family)
VTDWLWFREVGYQVVFSKSITTRIALFFIAAAIVYSFLSINVRLARSGPAKVPVLWRLSPEMPPVDVAASLMKVAMPLTLVLTLLFAVGATGGWMDVLQFVNRTPFGISDPVFGRDIGWYVFVLPVLDTLLSTLRSLVVLTLIGVVVIYLLRGKVSLPPATTHADLAG